MTPEEKALLEKHGCNCDYYGAGNCLTHNPKHPTHVIATLRAQLAQLQQENIELAAMVEGLTKTLREYANENNWYSPDDESLEYDTWIYRGGGFKFAKEALSQSPPTEYAAKVLALARAAIYFNEAMNQDRSLMIEDAEKRLLTAAATFTPEDIKLLNGGM